MVEQITSGEYRLEIHEDDEPLSPRDNDNLARLICWHSRYRLGDPHDYADKDAFFFSLLEEKLGDADRAQEQIDRIAEDVVNDGNVRLRYRERAADQQIIRSLSDEHIIRPFYLYDHSVLSISLTSFLGRAPHASWDSGVVGFAHITKTNIIREFGAWDKDTLSKAEQTLRGEVGEYDHYLRGDCYRYELYKGNLLIDSCGRFIGEERDVRGLILSSMPEDFVPLAPGRQSIEMQGEGPACRSNRNVPIIGASTAFVAPNPACWGQGPQAPTSKSYILIEAVLL